MYRFGRPKHADISIADPLLGDPANRRGLSEDPLVAPHCTTGDQGARHPPWRAHGVFVSCPWARAEADPSLVESEYRERRTGMQTGDQFCPFDERF